ncbi:MAG: hypothetical protein JSV80_17780, partial [Acidobacteriota bacterium]
AVSRLARELGVPDSRVHAVPIQFDADGSYCRFDEDCPLTRGGGKRVVCQRVIAAHAGRSALVGDGGTDLEVRGICDLIVGFGGVVSRTLMRAQADAFVEGPTLFPVLGLLLTRGERDRLREFGLAFVLELAAGD